MLMDMPTLIHQCAPNVGPSTMSAIIRTESSGNPLAINDNTAPLLRAPVTAEEAAAIAKSLIALGHSVDLGLGQVNSRNLPALGLTVEQVFEPCTNVAAAAAILTSAYQRATRDHQRGQPALLAALSAYNTGNTVAGFQNGYVQRVLSNAGLPVAIAIPSLAPGTVFRGRRSTVRVQRDGAVTPYTSPLDAWHATPAEPATAPAQAQLPHEAYTPRNSPLAIAGF